MQAKAPYHSARTTMALASKQSGRSGVPCYPALLTRTLSNTFVMWSSVWRPGIRGPRNVSQLERFVVEEWDRIAQRTFEVRGFHAQ